MQANASITAAWVRGLGVGDAAGGALVAAAAREATVLLGEDGVIADGYLALARLELLAMARRDLDRALSLAATDAAVLDSACRSVARDCAAQATETGSIISNHALDSCLECIGALDTRRTLLEASSSLDDGTRAASAAATFHCSTMTGLVSLAAPGGACFPLFGRFRREADLGSLVGAALVPPITLPVEISTVPDAVDGYEAAAILLRRVCGVCSLLANQAHLIRQTYLLRFALLMHVLTRVLPLPRPRYDAVTGAQTSARDCFWRRAPIRRETQVDLLHLLRRTSRHLTCVALSLKVTHSLDAARILAAGCTAVVTDAVLRRLAIDTPSWLSLHYSGDAQGPTMPFGFDLGVYDVESRYSAFVEPHLCAARTIILDYFAGLRAAVVDDRLIFAFERADVFGVGERTIFNQLCLQTGTPLLEQPEVYLTGERRDLACILRPYEQSREYVAHLCLGRHLSRACMLPGRGVCIQSIAGPNVGCTPTSACVAA